MPKVYHVYRLLVLGFPALFPFQNAVALDLDPRRSGAHYAAAWSPESVVVSQDLAFIAGGQGGLRLIDLSDPQHPRPLSSVETGGYATDLAVQGDLVLLVQRSSSSQFSIPGNITHRLIAIDIKDPRNPRVTGQLEFPDASAEAVAVSGNLAYVAAGNSGLQIIDISDPAGLRVVGSNDSIGFARDITISDGYGIVAVSTSDGDGISVIHISDPPNPRLIGSYEADFDHFAAEGNLVALAASQRGTLEILDLSNPMEPAHAGVYEGLAAVDLAIANRLAYVLDRNSVLHVIDLTDPGTPRLLGEHRISGWQGTAGAIDVVDGLAIVVNAGSRLTTLDISDPENLQRLGAYGARTTSSDMALFEQYALIADAAAGFEIYDVTSGNPDRVGGYLFDSPAESLRSSIRE